MSVENITCFNHNQKVGSINEQPAKKNNQNLCLKFEPELPTDVFRNLANVSFSKLISRYKQTLNNKLVNLLRIFLKL
jgi:hypothetical protein